MDHLSPLLRSLTPVAGIYHAGALCTAADIEPGAAVGHLHVLRSGCLRVTAPDDDPVEIDRPSALFYTRPVRHRLEPVGGHVDLVCATVHFAEGPSTPVIGVLPSTVLVALDEAEGLAEAQALLFREAFEGGPGREVALGSLMQYVVVLVLRHAAHRDAVGPGLWAGLADPRIARALHAMHGRPGARWTVGTLAREAGMSRARFAHRFRTLVGTPALGYLTGVRWASRCGC